MKVIAHCSQPEVPNVVEVPVCSNLRTSKLKTAALEHLRLDLRNRFEGLHLDEDASPEGEWREIKDAVSDASQAHIGKTHRRRRHWVTGESIALAEQARLARIQSAPNHRELRRQTKRVLRRDRNAFWKAIAEETERAAACGDTRKLYQMLKRVSRRPAGVGEVLLERDGSVIPDQSRKLCRWEEHFKELLNHAAPPNTAFSPLDTPAAENNPC